jgi:hypothetical protein
MNRSVFIFGLFVGVWLLFSNSLPAQTDTYTAPAGSLPPVAPPVRKGSPLDHLANDVKLATPIVGYKEGRTGSPDYWIAHRFVDDMGGSGWGWVKKKDDGWGSGKWVVLQEHPGMAVAPFRKLTTHDADNNWEFKFWGSIAPYKAYDPHLDEMVPVFILEGYEVLGPKDPLSIKTGPPDRVRHRASGASSRNNRPILTDPRVD